MKKTIYLIFLFFFPIAIYSQSWEALSDKIIDYYSEGNYEKALETADKALKKAEKDFGTRHKNYGESLLNKAFILQILDEDKTAEDLYLKGLEIIRKAIGENSLDYAYSLEFVGSFYMYNARYHDAKPYIEKCIEIKKNELGEDNDDYAYTLNDLAFIHEFIGNYQESERLYLKVKKIRRDVLGEESEDFIKTLISIAGLYDKMGRYGESEGTYEYAINLCDKVLGKNNETYAQSINKLANLYFGMGNYGQCKPLYLEAIKIRKAVLGERDPLYATSLINYALLNEKLFNLKETEALYKQAKEIMEYNYGENHPITASLYNNMASLYQTLGEFKKAEDYYLKSLDIIKASYGEENRDFALYAANLADLYTSIGNYTKAEPLLLKALEIEKNILGEEHPDYASDLSDLAALYGYMGRYDEALPLFLKSLEIIKKSLGKQSEAYSLGLNKLANLYYSQGLYKKCHELLNESLQIIEDILGTENLTYSITLLNLGNILQHEEEYEKAENYFKRVIEIRKKILPENHYQLGYAIYKLATLYDDMIELDKAIPLYAESMQIIKNSLGTNNLDYANLLNRLAQLYELVENKRPLAEEYFIEAQKIIENKYGKNHKYYIAITDNLGLFYAEEGKIDKAKKILVEANELTYKLIDNNFLTLSEEDKELFFKTVKNAFDAYNTFYLKNYKEHPELSMYLYNNELKNKGLLLSSNQSLRNNILKTEDKDLIEKYNEWIDTRKLIAAEKSLPLIDRDSTTLSILEEKAANLEQELQLLIDITEFSTIQSDWKKIKDNLDENNASVEFFNFSYNLFGTSDSIIYGAAIIKNNSKSPIIFSLFNNNQLDKLINQKISREYLVTQLYDSKRGAGTLNTDISLSKSDSLFQLIWEPLEPYLEGVEKIYFAPTGLLHQISFAALPDPNGKYLSDKYNLNYVSSTRQLVLDDPETGYINNNKTLAIYGGIEYEVDSTSLIHLAQNYQKNDDVLFAQRGIIPNEGLTRGSWEYLYGTKVEAENILKLFQEKQVLAFQHIGKTATEESFKFLSGSNAPNVIHVASHGFFFPDLEQKPGSEITMRGGKDVFKYADNPLFRSGLLFAGANRTWRGESRIEGVEDGILTAYEVSNMNLLNTDLVVMSACETGLGDIKGSEGVYGLQRSFKMAGVDYLIMSLWQVPDQETVEFMELFYKEWLSGKHIRQAFNDAQLVMRRKYDPYYWAAFVLIN